MRDQEFTQWALFTYCASVAAVHHRKLMKGESVLKKTTLKDKVGTEFVVYTSMSNAAVFKHCRVSDAETELRVRRLRWMQKVVAEPTNHRQAIAGIFGRCRMDDSEALDEEGRLTAEANSYAVRWVQDVETIADMQGVNNYSSTSKRNQCICSNSK